MRSIGTRRGWMRPVVGVGLAVAVLFFLSRPGRAGEADFGAFAFLLLLLFVSSMAGIVCALVACLRLFRLASLPRLYRRSLYVFITGNAVLVLNGWWAEAIERPEGLYPMFIVALVGAAVVTVVGSILLRSRGQRSAPSAG